MILQTTLCLAAAAAVINFWLMVRVGRTRQATKILHGDGGNEMLGRRMRAQANFVEYTPFVLILAALVEMTGKAGTWLAIVGSVYMLARVVHAFGMEKTELNAMRGIGIGVTVLTLLGLAVVAVLIALGVI
ncbi:MAG TPA: MAPEG family protein [Novosphingobium sp.]|nr:MAPEG family protein [Novosphingobium sp.]